MNKSTHINMPVHGESHGEKASLGRALWRGMGFAGHTVIRETSLIRKHLSGDLQDLGSQALRYLQKLGSRQGAVVLPVGPPCPWLIFMWIAVAMAPGLTDRRKVEGTRASP